MSSEPGWYWWAGYNGEVDGEGLYALGDFPSREEAIAAGQANMPDIDGNMSFHIIEAQFGAAEVDEDGVLLDDFVPFSNTRNHVIIEAKEAT